MVSQTQASQNDIDDQRFAELLKPIKDLTQNWEVPLATLLSQYIDDLQHVTISFDGGETSVNFAEAALLLQGTASVYSKKVDFLWQMVLQTLDMLRSKKGEEESEDGNGEAGPSGKGKKKHHLDMTREFGFLEAELGKNIDYKHDDESLTERKNALNFIYITPRQLIEKEGSEQKSVKVNLYLGIQQGKYDILAAKEDFRINSQYVSVTGGLGEDLTIDNQYLSFGDNETADDSMNCPFSPLPATPTVEASPNETPMTENVSPVEDVSPAEDSHIQADMSIANVSHASVHAVGFQNDSFAEPECLASPNITKLDSTPEPEFDPWAPLDPYEQVNTPKPMKKGKTIRLPPSLTGKQKKAKPLPPIEQFLVQEMAATLYNPSTLPDVHPAFYDLAVVEAMRRRQIEKEERQLQINKNPAVKRGLFEEPPDDDDFHADHNDYEEPVDAQDQMPDDIADDDLPNPHLGGEVGPFVMEDNVDAVETYDDNREEDCYEELVAKRVAEFIQKSNEFLKSSELTRRVAKWHEMIGPRLDLVERRKAFDVHLYGSGVLNTFKRGDSSLIDFGDVVRGHKGEEVARYFLSTLMLANTENVEIRCKPGTDPQLGMDNVQLKFLSANRHHEELAEFQAASQSESVDNIVPSPQPSTSSKAAAVEEGPYKAKKRPKKVALSDSDENDLSFGGSDSDNEFKVPKATVKRKGKKLKQ